MSDSGIPESGRKNIKYIDLGLDSHLLSRADNDWQSPKLTFFETRVRRSLHLRLEEPVLRERVWPGALPGVCDSVSMSR